MSELANVPVAGPEDRVLSSTIANQLLSLRKCYSIADPTQPVIDLLDEQPALYSLLSEAVMPIEKAFGEGHILEMRAQFSDDDGLLKVTIQLPADFGPDPEIGLESFDRDWWLDNCHRSGGALVFDYEIQDAV